MRDEDFGSVDDYREAFQTVQCEGIAEKQIELLQAHFRAPRHTATAAQLARSVGYANYGGTNLRYGALARRIGSILGFNEPPEGYWVHVLVEFNGRDPRTGHSTLTLRDVVIQALTRVGILSPGRHRSASRNKKRR